MSRWHHTGKQVLQDGRHFADAAGEVEAMMIVNAMRALDHPDRPPIYQRIGAPVQPTIGNVVRDAVRRRPILNLNECRVMRQSDEMVCACGLRWDINDEEPPRCAHRK